MQQLIPLIKDLAASFTRQQLRFAFGGALANNFWGIVRTTQDIDCLVAIPAMKYQLIADELSSIGCDMREDDGNLVPVTVPRMRDHADRRKLIECFRDSIRVELFVPVIPLQHELLRRGVWMPLDDQQIPITTAEDLVLLKLAFHREKDLQDVRGILWVQRGRLDLAYLRRWSTEMFADEVRSELEALIAQYANSD